MKQYTKDEAKEALEKIVNGYLNDKDNEKYEAVLDTLPDGSKAYIVQGRYEAIIIELCNGYYAMHKVGEMIQQVKFNGYINGRKTVGMVVVFRDKLHSNQTPEYVQKRVDLHSGIGNDYGVKVGILDDGEVVGG